MLGVVSNCLLRLDWCWMGGNRFNCQGGRLVIKFKQGGRSVIKFREGGRLVIKSNKGGRLVICFKVEDCAPPFIL